MDVKDVYDYVLDQSQAVTARVQTDNLGLPTPDRDWTVRQLMQHMLTELVWLPDMLAGKTIAEVGVAHDGDLLGVEPGESWQRAVETARQAVELVDVAAIAHLSYADKPVSEYLLESANDLLVHTWDLGQAIGVNVVFDEAIAQTLYKYMAPRRQELVHSGLFGTPLEVPGTASTQTKLLALLGRSEDWPERL